MLFGAVVHIGWIVTFFVPREDDRAKFLLT